LVVAVVRAHKLEAHQLLEVLVVAGLMQLIQLVQQALQGKVVLVVMAQLLHLQLVVGVAVQAL
jgi:hypothetical protein